MPYSDPIKQKESQHRSYLKNKDKVYERTKQTRLKWREVVHNIKNSPCVDCGLLYPYYVMDFDHRDGVEKIANISTLLSWSGLPSALKEIEKCDLVCANCHRIRTWKRIHKKSLC